MKTVTNAEVDALAAAVPTPYGALTRVTDFELYPEPNSGIRGQFTSNLSVTVWFSAEELENPELTLKLNQQFHSTPGVFTPIVAEMLVNIDELDALGAGMSTPHTYEDYILLRDYIATHFRWAQGAVVGNG